MAGSGCVRTPPASAAILPAGRLRPSQPRAAPDTSTGRHRRRTPPTSPGTVCVAAQPLQVAGDERVPAVPERRRRSGDGGLSTDFGRRVLASSRYRPEPRGEHGVDQPANSCVHHAHHVVVVPVVVVAVPAVRARRRPGRQLVTERRPSRRRGGAMSPRIRRAPRGAPSRRGGPTCRRPARPRTASAGVASSSASARVSQRSTRWTAPVPQSLSGFVQPGAILLFHETGEPPAGSISCGWLTPVEAAAPLPLTRAPRRQVGSDADGRGPGTSRCGSTRCRVAFDVHPVEAHGDRRHGRCEVGGVGHLALVERPERRGGVRGHEPLTRWRATGHGCAVDGGAGRRPGRGRCATPSWRRRRAWSSGRHSPSNT